MGLEKRGSKGGVGYVGGLLHLFDWNGKSRKKLLYNKFDLPEGTKQGKRSDENLPMTRVCLIEEDENGGVSSTKGSSDYSCGSSVTDDEGNGTRAPGVVARLMGLDSLPTFTGTEPYSTPYFDSRSLRDAHQKKAHEFHNEYQVIFNSQSNRVEDFSRRNAESRPQKVPNSPIERFQCEPLPPKSAKSHPVTHHKLLSPIKNPGFILPKNAADIMEAAAKILEPGYHTATKGKSLSLGSSSIPVKVSNLKENVAASQRPSRLSETSRKPTESNAVKYLKGQSLNKSWNGSDDTPNNNVSSNSEENHSLGTRNKGKSISLAIQAKVNVQRREGLSSSSRGLLIQKEEDAYKSNQSLKSQPTTTKNRQYKPSTSSSSGVLRQNNQKQNCPTNKGKLPSKPSVSSQQDRKVPSGDGSFGRNKKINKVSGSSKVTKKEPSEMVNLEREAPTSRTKNFPRKKRAMNDDLYSDKTGIVSTSLADSYEKSVQSHVAINEHLNWADDRRRKGMDVVSFTFTSPMIKPASASQSSGQMVEKQNATNFCFADSHGERAATDAKDKSLSSLGLNVIGGDALSVLLEQKLRELTSGLESSSISNSGKTGMLAASASIMEDLTSALNTVNVIPREFDRKSLPRHQKNELLGGFSYGCSTTNGQLLEMDHRLLGADEMLECSSCSDVQKELECQHPSPVSIFEASFSNESSNSSESCESNNGSKLCSVQAQDLASVKYLKGIPSLEAETELSDSASSTFMEMVDREYAAGISEPDQMGADKQELGYMREILLNTKLIFKDLPLSCAHEIVDPSLFDKLENRRTQPENEGNDKYHRLNRREMFDHVSEFVDAKCSHYTGCGYRTWVQGVAAVNEERLAEEVYKEVLQCRSMGDWMVDELVEKDMSCRLGRWLDFEAETSEMGAVIEMEILCSLINEVVACIL